MSQINKKTRSTWDDKAKGIRGNKLQSSAWESAIAVFWFIVGVIGAACNFIIKNKKNILDFCYNVMMLGSTLYAFFYPSKDGPKVNNRKSRSKK